MNKKGVSGKGPSVVLSVVIILGFLIFIFIMDVTSRITPVAPPPDPRREIIFYHKILDSESGVNKGYFVTKNGELYTFIIPESNAAFSPDYLYNVIESKKSSGGKSQKTVDEADLHGFIHNAFEYDFPGSEDTGYYVETGNHIFTAFDPTAPEFSEIISRWDKLWLNSSSEATYKIWRNEQSGNVQNT